MRNLFAYLALCASLAISGPCFAGDLEGVYVEPKLFGTFQHLSRASMSTQSIPAISAPPSTDYKTGVGAGIAVGYDFYPKCKLPVRAEVEYASRSKIDTQGSEQTFAGYSFSSSRKVQASTLFANIYYDFRNDSKFTPYVGGGVGSAFIQSRDYSSFSYTGAPFQINSDSAKNYTNFAWNAAAGVAYSFDQHWSLDLGYRYVDFGRLQGSDMNLFVSPTPFRISSDFSGHEIGLGLRYSF